MACEHMKLSGCINICLCDYIQVSLFVDIYAYGKEGYDDTASTILFFLKSRNFMENLKNTETY